MSRRDAYRSGKRVGRKAYGTDNAQGIHDALVESRSLDGSKTRANLLQAFHDGFLEGLDLQGKVTFRSRWNKIGNYSQ